MSKLSDACAAIRKIGPLYLDDVSQLLNTVRTSMANVHTDPESDIALDLELLADRCEYERSEE